MLQYEPTGRLKVVRIRLWPLYQVLALVTLDHEIVEFAGLTVLKSVTNQARLVTLTSALEESTSKRSVQAKQCQAKEVAGRHGAR